MRPDVIVLAKGLASGMPLSAIGARAEVMDRWPVGSHGGTYGGNPVAVAAALATIDVLREDGFLAGVRQRGEELAAALRPIQEREGARLDVRGLGLMVGCEFRDAAGSPDTARVRSILAHCLEHGRLVLLSCGTYGSVVRWIPPLVASSAQIAEGVAAFAAAVEATR